MAKSRSFTMSLGRGAGAMKIGSITSPDFIASSGGGLAELAFADFVNGVYRVGGATVAVEDLFGNDPSGNFSDFDANAISETGYAGCGTIVPTAALALRTAGFTLVAHVDVGEISTGYGHFLIEVFDTDFNGDWMASVGIDNHPTLNDFMKLRSNGSLQTTAPLVGLDFTLAITIAPDHVSVSANGGAVVTKTGPVTGWEAADIIVFDNANNAGTQELVFYPPQPDAALPGLSAP